MSCGKPHGDRNEILSNKLKDEGIYFDWSITISFYSVIHYIEDKAFPITFLDKTCNSLRDYMNAQSIISRHTARRRLVGQKFPSILSKYKWLEDKSRFSRYEDYNITEAEANQALRYLSNIKECCYE
ncbi:MULTISPECIES: hypothetical protein [Elizabethkingia]|uniref:hypothetical protein n=1 Tax=Elizabethkingia TaxID=308865 RepID=UPI0010C21810|nr:MULTISPECIES: hypothetical protein [Elizabethkingia]QCO45773.1 hypothetical protein FCS00_05085 [Elizabethkingia sp. 2-6]WQM37674.1 hypothetical protein U2S95_15045 [Elizabethkingia miricola]DAN07587.1 MAG TPA: hypothetical protein [Crassvirales sp.]